MLFPFDPVIATTGASTARAKSSISPMIGTPRAAAACNAGSRTDTPGLTTISTARIEHRRIESTATDLDLGELRLDRGTARRVLARIHRNDSSDLSVRAGEVADARQPRLTQTDDEHMAGR